MQFDIVTRDGMTSSGELYASAGIAHHMEQDKGFDKEILDCVQRYKIGDWGDMCDEDDQANDKAVSSGQDRILAAYNTSAGKVYIITEWDRKYTTVLFADEY